MKAKILRNRLLVGVLLLWVALAAGPVSAQVLDPAFHIPELYTEGQVFDAVQQPNGYCVVLGYFARVGGQSASGLARLDAMGALDPVFQQNIIGKILYINANIYSGLNGQLLVPGEYRVGAVQRHFLFRLNADGTLDASFEARLPGLEQVRQCIVQPDGRILIVRDVTVGSGSTARRSTGVSRLLSDGTPDSSFNTSINLYSGGEMQMLLQPDGRIFFSAASSFEINGVDCLIGRVNNNGTTDASYQPLTRARRSSEVFCMALDANGALLVGGASSATTPSVIRLLSTGVFDPSFTLDASLSSRDCNGLTVQPGGQIAAQFRFASSTAAGLTFYPWGSQLQRLVPSGAIDATFQPGSGPDYFLNGLKGVANGELLVWGQFCNISGQRRTLALLHPNGNLNLGFAPLLQVPGTAEKIVRQANGKLIITGNFNSIDGHPTDRVGCLLPNGQPDLNFSWRQPNSATWKTSAVAPMINGQVLLAGQAAHYTGIINDAVQQEQLFVRLDATGIPDASFIPAIIPNQIPYGIRLLAELTNGQVVVGGNFADAAGKANLTRLTNTGSIEPTFAPLANMPVVAQGLVQANGAIVVVVPSPPSSSLGPTVMRTLPNGAADPTFSYMPAASSTTAGLPNRGLERITQLTATGGYVTSGVFTSTKVLASVTATGANIASFTSAFSAISGLSVPKSGVLATAIQGDGKILVGGFMQQDSVLGTPVVSLGRLNANGQPDTTFDMQFITNPPGYGESTVAGLVVQPDGAIVVAGRFFRAGGQPVTGLVRLLPRGVLATSRPQHGPATTVYPNPAHGNLRLSTDAAARPRQATLLDATGRTVRAQLITQPDQLLPTAGLAPGLYLLRVDYASGPVTQRVVLE